MLRNTSGDCFSVLGGWLLFSVQYPKIYKRVMQECLTQVVVVLACHTRGFCKRVLEWPFTKVACKPDIQERFASVSSKSVVQVCHANVCSRDCLARVVGKSVLRQCLPNVACQRAVRDMPGCLVTVSCMGALCECLAGGLGVSCQPVLQGWAFGKGFCNVRRSVSQDRIDMQQPLAKVTCKLAVQTFLATMLGKMSLKSFPQTHVTQEHLARETPECFDAGAGKGQMRW